MDKRNYHIDVLRFLASLAVLIFHINQPIPIVDNWYRSVIKYGWLGVPMFFVISGYCIILSINPSTTAFKFSIKRLFRIFPPYWTSIILVLLAGVVQKVYLGNNMVPNIPRTLEGVLATITLTTAPVSSVPIINWVYWTLSYEFFFYMVIALILCFNKKLMLPLLIVVSISSLFVGQLVGPLFFLYLWPTFALGISVFLLSRSSTNGFNIPNAVLFIINFYGLVHQFAFSAFTICALTTTVLIFISQYIPSSSTIFSKMGQHSYSVYLIHVPLGIYLIGLLNVDRRGVLSNIIYDIAVYVIISVFAWLMFAYLEVPSVEFGKVFENKYRKSKVIK